MQRAKYSATVANATIASQMHKYGYPSQTGIKLTGLLTALVRAKIVIGISTNQSHTRTRFHQKMIGKTDQEGCSVV